MKKPPFERLLERIVPDGECWRWVGSHTHDGYGLIGRGSARSQLTHRLAYEEAIGPIPPGLTVDHVAARGCRFRDCVNPSHLEAVTLRENLLRGRNPSAVNARKVRCKNGHLLAEGNLVMSVKRRTGNRLCRTCANAYARRWQTAKRRRAAECV